jgi:hypothetical protein
MIRKGIAVGIILLLLVSVVPFIQGESHTGIDEFTIDNDSYRYASDWSVHLTNETTSEETRVFYTNVESNDNGISSQDGPMDAPWSMLSHDVYHTGRSQYSTENNPGGEIWRVRGDKAGAVWSSAVIDNDGIIYFGTKGSDSSLYALYPNGTRKWRFPATDLIWGTPALSEDGVIYFTTWGQDFFAVNPNGTERWRFNQDMISTSSCTIGNDGTIYFGTDGHTIFAVNPDGTEKWRYTTGSYVNGAAAIGEDGTIYIGSCDCNLYALNPNGTVLWQFHTGGEIKGSPTIAPDGTIYAPSFDGYLYALYPNGTIKWKVTTGDSVASAGVALAEDGTIYVGTEILRAYYPNGTLRWELDVQGDIYGTVPAVSADGTIYVSAGDSLVAVNPDGTEKWRKQLTTAQIHSSPCVGPDDRVYVGSEGSGLSPVGYLSAFGIGPLYVEAGGPYSGMASYTPIQCKGLVFGGHPLYTYLWDFGDGNTSDEENPSHLYKNIGTYNITFTVTDNEGNLSSDTTTSTITYGPPSLTFIKPVPGIYFANLRIFPFQYPLVFGKITVEVNATHPFLPIERVEFYKWDQLQSTDTTPPYTWTWSDRISLRGTHYIGITVFAYTSDSYGYDYIEITKYF